MWSQRVNLQPLGLNWLSQRVRRRCRANPERNHVNFTDFFIHRAVTTTLLMAAILIWIFSYSTPPGERSSAGGIPHHPGVRFAARARSNPDTMASTVATPLERQFTTIAGIDSMSSSSSLGRTTITLQFTLERNIDAAAQDVQAAISQASRSLPPDMPTPPLQQSKSGGSASVVSQCALENDDARRSTSTPQISSSNASRW